MRIKRQIILLAVICLMIAFVMVWFLVIPLFGTIRQISSELVGVKKELAIIHNKTGEVQEVDNVCDKIDPDLQKMKNLLVNKEVPIRVIEFLENTADDSNLSIKISPVSLKNYKDETWDFVSFRLDLSGSHTGFMRFLTKIENASFLIEAHDLSIREIIDELSSGDISAILTIKVFAN